MPKYVECCFLLTDDGSHISPDERTRAIPLTGFNGIATQEQNSAAGIGTNPTLPWPITISGSITAGDATYTTQLCYYFTIGNIVYVTGTLIWIGHTGSGNLLLTNLPKTAVNIPQLNPEFILTPVNITLPAQAVLLWAEIQVDTNTAIISTIDRHGTVTPLNLPVTGEVHFSGWYLFN